MTGPPKRPVKNTRRGHSHAEADAERTIPEQMPFGSTEREAASTSRPELRVISMKTPAELAAERARAPLQVESRAPAPEPRRPLIRPISEVSPTATPAHGLGRLAPPRDERDVRARKLNDYVLWGSVVVIVGSIVMLIVWLLAR